MNATLLTIEVVEPTVARRTHASRALHGFSRKVHGHEYQSAGIMSQVPHIRLAPWVYIVRTHYAARVRRRLASLPYLRVVCRPIQPLTEDLVVLGLEDSGTGEVST